IEAPDGAAFDVHDEFLIRDSASPRRECGRTAAPTREPLYRYRTRHIMGAGRPTTARDRCPGRHYDGTRSDGNPTMRTIFPAGERGGRRRSGQDPAATGTPRARAGKQVRRLPT